jgi:exonuclease SbcC
MKKDLLIKKGQEKYYIDELAKMGLNEIQAQHFYLSQHNKSKFNEYIYKQESTNKQILANKEADCSKLVEKIQTKKTNLGLLKSELNELIKKPVHKYTEKLEDMIRLFGVLQTLERKMTIEFPTALKKISSSNSLEELSESQKIYAEKVFIYLGRKISTLRHGEREYSVKKIDTIKHEIIADIDPPKTIKFEDLGTGQAQSAFLQGLLNTPDPRTSIVLFDEVEMMDESSLQPIKERLKDLYKAKKLLLGIIIKKGETIEVENIL